MEITSLLLPLGIIPSLFLLYFIIGGYEGKFEERSVFLSFIFGIVMGTIIYLIEGMVLYSSLSLYIDTILIISLLFSLLEQLAKLAVLNSRFFSKEGLPIYGASFGLGIASTFSPLLLGKSFEISIKNFLPILLPFSSILIGCATGIFIGIGIKRQSKAKYFSVAFLMGIILWIGIIFSFFYIYSPLFSIIFSLIAFYFAYKNFPSGMLSRRELRKFY